MRYKLASLFSGCGIPDEPVPEKKSRPRASRNRDAPVCFSGPRLSRAGTVIPPLPGLFRALTTRLPERIHRFHIPQDRMHDNAPGPANNACPLPATRWPARTKTRWTKLQRLIFPVSYDKVFCRQESYFLPTNNKKLFCR